MHEVNERLAKAVRDRREGQGWTQANVNAQGGPSGTTQSKIEAGRGQLGAKTLKQLDAGLQWPAGTALAILTGKATQTPRPRQGLGGWSDDELLEEIRDRLRGRSEGNATPQIIDAEGTSVPTQDTMTLASDHERYDEGPP